MASVQFNLLPEIKMDYIRAQGTRNKITAAAVLISAVSLAILIVMILSVEVVQRKQLNDAAKQITSTSTNIKNEPQILKILTVQNQLQTLVSLHADKHITSRVFDYLSQVTPPNVSLGRLSIDYETNTMTIDGQADTAASVNKFIDTLKFTNYTVGDDSTTKTAFPSVIENNFSISAADVSYSLDVQFAPDLFSNNLHNSSGVSVAPKLQVPNQTTTRSALDDPNSLFKGTQGQ